MATKKPVPRAVLEERLRNLEATRSRRRLFAVSAGVYVAVLAGVLASQAVVMSDDLNAVLQPLELGQLAGGVIVAALSYSKIEGTAGELSGKAKKGNVGRVLVSAFSHGMMWMTMLGAWW